VVSRLEFEFVFFAIKTVPIKTSNSNTTFNIHETESLLCVSSRNMIVCLC
jgi:hypothetical protein